MNKNGLIFLWIMVNEASVFHSIGFGFRSSLVLLYNFTFYIYTIDLCIWADEEAMTD